MKEIVSSIAITIFETYTSMKLLSFASFNMFLCVKQIFLVALNKGCHNLINSEGDGEGDVDKIFYLI